MENMAIVVHGPMDIRWEDRGIKKPGYGEVLIRVVAAGLCGTDVDVLTNELFYFKTGMAKLPLVPGHEWSGIIEAVGEGVKDFRIGDHVSGECTVSCGHCTQCQTGHRNLCTNRTETGVMNRDGGYAHYITFPVTALHKFNGVEFEEAALIEPACVATNAVRRARVSPMDNVLIVGPGPIGLLAAQAAKKVYGAKRVIITGTRDERLSRAKDFTDAQINVRTEDAVARIMEITGGEGVNVIVEAAGAADTFAFAQKVAAPAARIALCGFFHDVKPFDWNFVCTGDVEIIGSLGSPGIWDFVISLIESGKIDMKCIISHRLPLDSKESFMKGLGIMTERKENVCKVVFRL